MWSQLVGALTGLLLSLIITFSLYFVAIEPLVNYDIDSFFPDQDKSLVYTRSLLTLEQITNKVLDHKPFTKEQLIMLPAVDVNTTLQNEERLIKVWQDITYSSKGIKKISLQRQGKYVINLDSIYNKHTSFTSYFFTDVSTNLGSLPNAKMNYMVNPDGTLEFFLNDRKAR